MPDSIGSRLKQAREARGLTLDKAAEATRIRRHYLQALENDDYSVMSSAAQGRGFLRLYADYLGLNLEQLTAALRAEAASTPAASDVPAPVSPAEPTPAPASFWSRLTRRPADETAPAEPASAPAVDEMPSVAAPAPEAEPVAGPETETAPFVEEAPRRARRSSSTRSAKPARGGKSTAKKRPSGKSRPAAKKRSPVKKNSKPSRRSKS